MSKKFDNQYDLIHCPEDLDKYYRVADERYIAGHAIGIVAIDLQYPKMPGNVVNALTYKYPVLYKKVEFEIERLFEGDPTIKDDVIAAAKALEADGVRAVIGACGFFANFQEEIADALEVPAFMTSMLQLPMIKMGLKKGEKIGIITASGSNVTDEMLIKMGVQPEDCYVQDLENVEGFAYIRRLKDHLQNKEVGDSVVEAAEKLVTEHDDVGAILLECSDIPPYAYRVQQATGLPVFDFITLINWAHDAVTQTPYYGHF